MRKKKKKERKIIQVEKSRNDCKVYFSIFL